MMRTWKVRDAAARFSALLEASLKEGPQLVTKRGVETAVIVPVGEWRRLQRTARPSLKQLLLADAPRMDIPVPQRGKLRLRAARHPSPRV